MDSGNSIQRTIYFHHHPIKVDVYSKPNHQHTIILLPALGIAIQKYQTLIGLLVDHHFNVIAADYPHCGRNTPVISSEIDFGYQDLLINFIPQLVQISLHNTGRQPILFGHSLGGHLATLYAQNHAIKVIGIATGNIGLKYWDLKGKFNILKAVSMINAMILKDGYFAGYKIAFGNRETKTLMRDWSKVVFTGNYKHIVSSERIVGNDALFIYLQGDDFAPLSSMLGLKRYFNAPTIETLDLTHTIKGNQHSAWIKQPDQVVSTILEWL